MSRRSWDEFRLVEQRLIVAAEEATALGYLLLPERDRRRGGIVREYPPKDPGECSAILSHWLVEGLIGLFDVVTDDPVSYDEAARLLATPSEWADHPATPVVAFSDVGRAVFPAPGR